jgi:general stress protein YciG
MTSKKGFAGMSDDKVKEIASKGGKTAHENGTAHQFTTDEARKAGKKGGLSVSQDRQHMSEIGKRGALKRMENKRKALEELMKTTSEVMGSDDT